MRNDKTIEDIKEILENEEMIIYRGIDKFFNLLFWKNYGEGYVNVEDKSNIFKEIKINLKEYGDYTDLNSKGILPFINKIRKQIGLPELTNKLDNILQEITPEIRKKLILKGLE